MNKNTKRRSECPSAPRFAAGVGAGLGVALTVLWAAVAAAQPSDPVFPDDGDPGNWDKVAERLWIVAVPRAQLTVGAMFLATFALALTGFGTGRAGKVRAAGEHGPQLPPRLRHVSVLNARYPLETYTGTVVSKESFTETNQSSYVVGGSWDAGGWASPWSRPVTISTITRKDVVWLRDANGGEHAWHFSKSPLAIAAGHLVSFVARPTAEGSLQCLAAFNHRSRQFVAFDAAGAHGIARMLAWLGGTLVGTTGFIWCCLAFGRSLYADAGVAAPLNAPLPLSGMLWLTAAIVAAIVALLPYLGALVAIPFARNKLFEIVYVGGIRRFLESIAPPPPR